MSNKILYHSTDKLYKIVGKKSLKRILTILSVVSTIILLVTIILLFKQSITINADNSAVQYKEVGKVDYKVYLKDNDYYDTSYLESGMQYVASLIKTINVKFNYEIHSTELLQLNNRYDITGKIEITEQNEPSKILLEKDVDLGKEKTTNVSDNNFVINDEIDIDYEKYNNIVNSYRKDYGLIISGNLILTLNTNTSGSYNQEKFNKDNKLQISIPLSESTLNIKMNSNEINNKESLGNSNKLIRIDDTKLFTILVFLIIILIFSIALDIYIYIKHYKKDIYKIKVGRILRDYDRLIATGTANIDERRYPNKFYPENFKEMVDIAQNLEVPIMYYEAIPNEKCFFIIIKDDTLYKYRLTKAFLEGDLTDENENEVETL